WVLIARGTAYSTRFPLIPSDGGLPHARARSATTLDVSRPAQRSLALRPVGSLHRQGDTSVSKAPTVSLPPHELPACCAVWGDCAEAVSGSSVGRRPQAPLTPSIANRYRRIWLLSVVHGHRPVARWRPPRSTHLLRGQRTELEAHRRRLPLQRLQHIGLHLGLVLFHRLRYVLLAVLEHPVDQTRQLVRGRLDCSESADPTADAAVEQAQRRHCLAQRPRTHPQRDGHSVGALAMAAAFLRLIALILRRAQPQPTREVLLSGKTAHVHADFTQNHQGRSHVDPLDQCQVHAQGLEQRARRLEPDVVALAPALPRLDSARLLSRPVGEFGQLCFDLLVALGDLPMMELVQLIGLPKLEEMFGPPRSVQRKGYLFLTVLTSLIAQLGQFDGVAC